MGPVELPLISSNALGCDTQRQAMVMHVITAGNRAPQLCVPRDCLYSQITFFPIAVYIKIPISAIKAAHHLFFKSSGPFYQHGLTLIPTWISNTIHDKCVMKLLVQS